MEGYESDGTKKQKKSGIELLSLETQDLTPEGTIEHFLITRQSAIHALRSYVTQQEKRELSDFEVEGFYDRVKEASFGSLSLSSGSLCEVNETTFLPGHDLRQGLTLFEPGSEPSGVRAFNFVFNTKWKKYDCLVLDSGRSRKYYDDLAKSDKQHAFTQAFANKLGVDGYGAIIEENSDGSFKLLDCAERQSPEYEDTSV